MVLQVERESEHRSGVFQVAVIVIQPFVPRYRWDFFDRVAASCGRELRIFGPGAPVDDQEGAPGRRAWSRTLAAPRTLGPLQLGWQPGSMDVPMGRGDVVVVSANPRYLSNVALLLKARGTGARTAWWGHYRSATTRLPGLAVRRLLMRWADAVLFYTDEECSLYSGCRLPGDPRAFALQNGLDVTEIARWRALYGTRPPQVLFVGRVQPKAELHLLIEALAQPGLEHVSLRVVGDGDTGPLRALSERLGVQRKIAWHGAMSEEASIAEVANECALFVYPGAVGLSLMHGMAYGLPAVLHGERNRHMPEIAAFRPGRTGLTFERGSAPDLARALGEALRDPSRLAAWSAECRRVTDEEFNTRVMAQRFVELVEYLAPLSAK